MNRPWKIFPRGPSKILQKSPFHHGDCPAVAYFPHNLSGTLVRHTKGLCFQAIPPDPICAPPTHTQQIICHPCNPQWLVRLSQISCHLLDLTRAELPLMVQVQLTHAHKSTHCPSMPTAPCLTFLTLLVLSSQPPSASPYLPLSLDKQVIIGCYQKVSH